MILFIKAELKLCGSHLAIVTNIIIYKVKSTSYRSI